MLFSMVSIHNIYIKLCVCRGFCNLYVIEWYGMECNTYVYVSFCYDDVHFIFVIFTVFL